MNGRLQNKVGRALSNWPRNMPLELCKSIVEWADHAACNEADEFANHVEYARATHREKVEMSKIHLRVNQGCSSEVAAAKTKLWVQREMTGETGMDRLSTLLMMDLNRIGAKEPLKKERHDSTEESTDVLEGLSDIPFQSATAEAYHAHKHPDAIPVSERRFEDPLVVAYRESLNRTTSEGEMGEMMPERGKSDPGDRILIYRRPADDFILEAVVYWKGDGRVVVATYQKKRRS